MTEQDRPRMGEQWTGLAEAGQVPDKGKGKSAERAERAKTRTSKRYPSEDERVGRKIGPTLSAELVERIRNICEQEGHPKGQIVSSVVEDLLRVGVEAYERGELRRVEIVQVSHRLSVKPPGRSE